LKQVDIELAVIIFCSYLLKTEQILYVEPARWGSTADIALMVKSYEK